MFPDVLVIIILGLLLSKYQVNTCELIVIFSSDTFFKFVIGFTVFSLQMLCAEFNKIPPPKTCYS